MSRAKALIVDDSEMNAEVLSEMILTFDIDSDMAFSGMEAMSFVSDTEYDIIFMDHLMTGMDGLATFRKMRECGYHEGKPVIMITANDSASDRDFFLEAGFSDYMNKPFSAQKLEFILNKYVFENGTEEYEWRQLAEKLPFLDVENMKKCYMNDTSFYIQLLHEYLKSDILVELDKLLYLEADEKLVIRLRAMKDSARLIGDTGFMKKTDEVERAVLADDEKAVYSGCKKLKRHTKKIFSELDRVLCKG